MRYRLVKAGSLVAGMYTVRNRVTCAGRDQPLTCVLGWATTVVVTYRCLRGQRVHETIESHDVSELRVLQDTVAHLREKLWFAEQQIEEFRSLEAQLLMAQVQVVEAIVGAIEAKDEYTSGHSRRVRELSLLIGAVLGLSTDRMWKLNIAALLHDVGKIGVYDSSLRKTTRLNSEELLQLKEHPVIGEGIINRIDFFRDVSRLVRSHHERFDGSGYPDQLCAEEIPLESKIICIADAYDAITSKRTYNKPLSPMKAVEEIERNTGTQFDPEVVQALRRALEPNDLPTVQLNDDDFGDFEIPNESEQD